MIDRKKLIESLMQTSAMELHGFSTHDLRSMSDETLIKLYSMIFGSITRSQFYASN